MLDGTITLENNDVYQRLKLRFQAFNNELVVYNENLLNLFVVDKEKGMLRAFKLLDDSGYFN